MGAQIEAVQARMQETELTYFTETPFRAETARSLDQINKEQGPKKQAWRYDCCTPTYYSMHYKFAGPDHLPDVILDESDVIRLWGLAAYQMAQYRHLTGRASSSTQ